MFTFSDTPSESEVSIDAGDGQQFTIKLRFPTCAERFEDGAMLHEVFDSSGPKRRKAYVDRAMYRLGFVTGWSGVKDQIGADIPFSKEVFQKLMSARPALMELVADAISSVFLPDENAEKKLAAGVMPATTNSQTS
jgi:hypothetical protein